MIILEHLQKTFSDGNAVLKDVNAVIQNGDIISVIGPSGTGKSTLLRCINMLDAPTGGKIILDDEEITDKNYSLDNLHKRVSMVFQGIHLFEHLSVIENVMLPQTLVLKKEKQEAYDTGMKILESVGMAQKARAYPSNLSGGQKQRVAIARTLAMNPEIILFDEPTSALDPTTVDEVRSVIKDVAKNGTTILIVTHDMELAKSICNRVFYMDCGGIYEDGTPEQIFENPKKELTKQFVRRIKTLEAYITDRSFDFPNLMSEIFSFGLKSQISTACIRDIQLITEELICSLLFFQLKEPFAIRVLYEYSGAEKQATMTVCYNGEKKPILEGEKNYENDVLTDSSLASIRLIRHYTDKVEYSYDAESELPNVLKLSIRKI